MDGGKQVSKISKREEIKMFSEEKLRGSKIMMENNKNSYYSLDIKGEK